jgi:hypothetical protein
MTDAGYRTWLQVEATVETAEVLALVEEFDRAGFTTHLAGVAGCWSIEVHHAALEPRELLRDAVPIVRRILGRGPSVTLRLVAGDRVYEIDSRRGDGEVA